jgi:hypothetical protein
MIHAGIFGSLLSHRETVSQCQVENARRFAEFILSFAEGSADISALSRICDIASDGERDEVRAPNGTPLILAFSRKRRRIIRSLLRSETFVRLGLRSELV